MTKPTFRGYNRVKFQSDKLGKTVFCSSLLLRDFLIHLEWNDDVISYDLKPFKIQFKLFDKQRNIRPHVLYKKSDQKLHIVWLKSSVTDTEEINQIKKLIANFCETKGFNFEVYLSDEIRKEPKFSNLKFLRKYSRSEVNLKQTILCRKFFDSFSNPLLGDLLGYFQNNNEDIQTVYALLSTKIVSADIHSQIINSDVSIKLENKFPEFQNGRLIV